VSYKNRWQEPTDRTARGEYRDLRRELKKGRPSKARRAEIEARLDAIAGTSFDEPKNILSEKGTPASASMLLEQPPALSKTDAEWAAVIKKVELDRLACILADPDKLAHRKRVNVATDRGNPLRLKAEARTDARDASIGWGAIWGYCDAMVRDGGRQHPENLPLLDAIDAEVARRDAADADWYARQWRAALDETERPTPPPAEPASKATPTDAEIQVMAKRDTPEPRPEILDRTDEAARLQSRAELILNLDASLTQLANLSADMRQQILSAITAQIQSTGFVDSLFCLKTYNTLRPKARADFPERRFTWMAR